MVAIFVGIRSGTTSAIRIRVVIVIRIAIVGAMPVAGGRVVAVMAEDDRRTRMAVAAELVVVVQVGAVVQLSQRLNR